MSQEMHYTSVPRGLKPGSSGFCTVAHTSNFPGPLLERLEGLSGYQQVFPPHDERASLNPVAITHLRITAGGRSYSVLSRVGFAGLDYSARSNKYAHHLVLDADERPKAGPAWLASQPGILQAAWEGEPRILQAARALPRGDLRPDVARNWQARTGDAGWAGVLAEAFLADPRKLAYLIFEPGMEILPLFTEAISLLPPERRWDVEFSTYFTQLPQGSLCQWRAVLAGSPEAKDVRRLPGTLVLDLRRPLGEAKGGELVHLARTGKLPERIQGSTSPEDSLVEPLATQPVESATHRLPGPARTLPTGPPDLSDRGSHPLRAPIIRSVRDLEGQSDDPDGLPWGRIVAGIVASLLVAVGAAWWSGIVVGLGFPWTRTSVDQILVDGSIELPRKGEESAKKPKEEEEKAKPKVSKVSSEKDTQKRGAAVESGREQSARTRSEQNRSIDTSTLSPSASAPHEQKPYKQIGFMELPGTGTKLDQNEAPQRVNKAANRPGELVFPSEISAIKIIFNDSAPDSQFNPSGNTLRQKDIENGLEVIKPSNGTLDVEIHIGKFVTEKNRLIFSWIDRPVQVALFEHFSDSVIIVNTIDKGTYFILLRHVADSPPIQSAEKIMIHGLRAKGRDVYKNRLSERIRWDKNNAIGGSGWDLKITSWNIEATLDQDESNVPLSFSNTGGLPAGSEISVESSAGESHDFRVKLHFTNGISAILNNKKADLRRIDQQIANLKNSDEAKSTNFEKLDLEKAEVLATLRQFKFLEEARTWRISFIITLHIGDERIEIGRFGTFAQTKP